MCGGNTIDVGADNCYPWISKFTASAADDSGEKTQ
jgi:hypothetical protein